MLREVAAQVASLPDLSPVVIDAGVGTGGLTAEILRARPGANVTGIDGDAAMLDVARKRLGAGSTFSTMHGDFTTVPLPPCDAIVGTLAFHHIRTHESKKAFYARCFSPLRDGGLLVSGDRMPESDASVAQEQHEAWIAHMSRSYSREESLRFLESWSGEDTYLPLEDELTLLDAAGFSVRIAWKKDGFATVVGTKSATHLDVTPLETERTVLRRLELRDLSDIFRAYSDVEAMRFRQNPPLTSMDEAREMIIDAWAQQRRGTSVRWAIEEKSSGRVIGTFLWKVGATGSETEVGYSLNKEWWGKGFMREVLRRMTSFLFEAKGYRRITAGVRRDNLASIALLERGGFRKVSSSGERLTFELTRPS